MKCLASRVADCKTNNLNLIRLLMALLVIWSHSFPVALDPGGDTRCEPLNVFTHHQSSSGAVAISSFFFISGFLITASWLRAKSAANYFMKRVLRIYPAFIVSLSFCAGLIWIFCPGFRATVVHPWDWWRLLFQDMLLLTYHSITGPGIFAANPFPMLANASLWTISLEFLCYLAVLLMGFCGLFKRRLFLLVAALFALVLFVIWSWSINDEFEKCLICFVAGATAWLWQDKIPFSNLIAGGCVAVLLAASQFRPWLLILFPILGGYCLLWLAYGPALVLASWTDKTDRSYATYLYAFPVQQMLAMHDELRHPWAIFALAAPITLVLAWLSWHLVEKRCLAWKRCSLKAA